MSYRTKTYIAGEWDGDNDAIEQLYQWNDGDKWAFHFIDAHANKQCYDTSLPCTIKNSLRERKKILDKNFEFLYDYLSVSSALYRTSDNFYNNSFH